MHFRFYAINIKNKLFYLLVRLLLEYLFFRLLCCLLMKTQSGNFKVKNHFSCKGYYFFLTFLPKFERQDNKFMKQILRS